TFPTRIQYDSRGIDERNLTLTAVFRNLQRARVSLEVAAGLLQTYAPAPASRVGEMLALSGLTKVYTAENYCSGVPFSSLSGPLGQPLTTSEIFQAASARFDSVLTLGIDTTKADSLTARKIVYLARLGKARALLDLAQPASAATWDSAAAIAAQVPLTFRYLTAHSVATNREVNGNHVFNSGSSAGGTGRFSVAEKEGINGLNFRTANDPRVVTVQQGLGFDAVTPLFALMKYPQNTSPTVVADGIEAQLI